MMQDPIVPLPPSPETAKAPSREDVEYEERKYTDLKDLIVDQLARLFVELAEHHRHKKVSDQKNSDSSES